MEPSASAAQRLAYVQKILDQSSPDEREVLVFADSAWSWLDDNDPSDHLATGAACLILDAASAGDLDPRYSDAQRAIAAATRLTIGA